MFSDWSSREVDDVRCLDLPLVLYRHDLVLDGDIHLYLLVEQLELLLVDCMFVLFIK